MANTFFHGIPFTVTALGTTTSTATIVVGANQIPYISDLTIGTDKGFGTAVVYSGGTATFWGYVSNTTMLDTDFQTFLPGVAGTNITIATTGTNFCMINVSGILVNNN